MLFSDVAEAQRAYESGLVDLHAKVKIRLKESEVNAEGQLVEKTVRYETTIGRALLSEILPAGLPFSVIDKALKKIATGVEKKRLVDLYIEFRRSREGALADETVDPQLGELVLLVQGGLLLYKRYG